MDFSNFIEWAFYGVVSGASIYAIKVLGDMRDSIQNLNVQVAVIITKHDNQEKRLAHYEERLLSLEHQN